MSDGIFGGFDLGGALGGDLDVSSMTTPTGLDASASVDGMGPLSSFVSGVDNAGSPLQPGNLLAMGNLLAGGGMGAMSQMQPVQQGGWLQSLMKQITGGSTPGMPGAQGLQNGMTNPAKTMQGVMGAVQKAFGGGGSAGGGGGGGQPAGGGGGGGAAPGWHPQNPMASMGLGAMAAQNFAQQHQMQQPQAIQPAGSLNPVRF